MERNKNTSRLKSICTLISFHNQKLSIISCARGAYQERVFTILNKFNRYQLEDLFFGKLWIEAPIKFRHDFSLIEA
jgi:hypothetical protein